MPHLSVGDVDLYYELTGQGQPLVFLHGLGSSTHDWDDQVAEFSRAYQVLTFDLRGHGQSAKPAGPYTMTQFAADTARLLTTLGLPSAHVVGLSLGGCVAFQLAVDSLAMVKTLTIVNSAPAMGISPEQARQEIDRRVGIVQRLGMRAMGEALSPTLFPKPEHAPLRETFVEHWAQNDPLAYIEATRSMLGWDVTGRLGSIRCPALIISADQDYTPVAVKEAYIKLMPTAELAVIPDAHHATPMEKPQVFNAVLAEFLARHN